MQSDLMSCKQSLSVVLATYNGAPYLAEQLASLAAQSARPDELVVCDDGSMDTSLERIEEFAKLAPFPVRIHRNDERLGYADNFLHGASLCEGDLIAFCDQDDLWHEKKLERCTAAFTDPEVLLAMHSATAVDETLHDLGYRQPSFRKSAVFNALRLDPFLHPLGFAMVFSSRLVKRLDYKQRPPDFTPGTERVMAHDQWVFFHAQVLGKVALISDSLVQYRQHRANTCGARPGETSSQFQLAKTTGESSYNRRADLCQHYSHILTMLAAREIDSWAGRFHAGAEYYQRLSASYTLRSRLHKTALSRIEKLRTFGRLWRERSYRNRHSGGLGWKALLKDLAALSGLASP